MHSFSAPPANIHYTTRIHPALIGFADECLRHAGAVCLPMWWRWPCLPLAASRLGAAARWHRHRARREGGPGAWPIAQRAAFAVSQIRFITIKQRLTRFSGIPRAAARTCLPLERRRQKAGRRARNLPPRRRTHPGRPCNRGNRRPDGPGRHARAGSRGRHRQQVRHRDAAALIGGGEPHARLPRLHQARRRTQFPDLRLVVPG